MMAVEAGDNNPDISDVINESGLRRPNGDLDVTTAWTTFPAQALNDDEDSGELDVMLGQGP